MAAVIVELGGREPRAGLAGKLLDCHDRIRACLDVAGRLASGEEASAEDVRAAAARVRRYFAEALPLHVADEDETLEPRLRGRDRAVDAALDRMHREHGEHEADVEGLVRACAALEADPAAPRPPVALVTRLRAALEEHLRAEEAAIVPAIDRLLDEATRERMLAELAARRDAAGRGRPGRDSA